MILGCLSQIELYSSIRVRVIYRVLPLSCQEGPEDRAHLHAHVRAVPRARPKSAKGTRLTEQPVGARAADEPAEPRVRPVARAAPRAGRDARAGARRRVQLRELTSRVAHRQFAPADVRTPRGRLARAARRRRPLQRRGPPARASSQGDPIRYATTTAYAYFMALQT